MKTLFQHTGESVWGMGPSWFDTVSIFQYTRDTQISTQRPWSLILLPWVLTENQFTNQENLMSISSLRTKQRFLPRYRQLTSHRRQTRTLWHLVCELTVRLWAQLNHGSILPLVHSARTTPGYFSVTSHLCSTVIMIWANSSWPAWPQRDHFSRMLIKPAGCSLRFLRVPQIFSSHNSSSNTALMVVSQWALNSTQNCLVDI